MAEELKVTEILAEKITPAAEPNTKTFSEDYVKAIREEAKENRLSKKAVESKLKKILGLKDEDDISDEKIAAFQTNQQTQLTAALQKANDRLLQAEIRGLDGYEPKLVERLLDKSKVKIADDGTVTGLAAAVEALAIEFPQVKKVVGAGGGANPPPSGNGKEELEDAALRKSMGLPPKK